MTLEQSIKSYARSLGFDVVGIARADENIDLEYSRYCDFIDQGMAGQMHYLAKYVKERKTLCSPSILENAKSVVCVGKRYVDEKTEDAESGVVPWIARYARGRDYHQFLRKDLKRLARYIEQLQSNVSTRTICDIEPVMERVWAARSGIGFIGKNGLIIVPGQGSFLLLGEVVTTLELIADRPIEERCGTCTLCLDACPTQAFVRPFMLDPRKCVSYLTIEQSDLPSEELQAQMGEHLFGCDDCQTVCPYNQSKHRSLTDTEPFQPKEIWEKESLQSLIQWSSEEWQVHTRGSPLRRAKRVGLARNAAIVAKNRLKNADCHNLDQDAVCAAAVHDSDVVRSVVGSSAT